MRIYMHFNTKLMTHYQVLRIPVVDTAVVVAETKEIKIFYINNKIIIIWNYKFHTNLMINNDFQQIPAVVGASVVVEVGSKEKIDTVQLWKKVLDSKETYLSIDNYNKIVQE